MDRALVNAQAALQVRYYADGVATDPAPDTATVTITRADGTAIVTGQPATATPGVDGEFTFTLSPAQNDRLDRLTAVWTSTLGSASTVMEMCGGFLIPAVDLVALYPGESNAERAARRNDIEQRLEAACGVAFVPRHERENLTACRRGRVHLKWGRVRSLRSVTVGSVLWSAGQVAALDVEPVTGVVWGLPTSRLHGDVTIEYEHGLDNPGQDCRAAARDALTETYGPDRVDGRILRKAVDHVEVTYARSSSSEFTSPRVVAFVHNHRRPLIA
jgi:hypothetical protein